MRVTLNLAVAAGCLLAASLVPSLAEAYGRAGPSASPFVVWPVAHTARHARPASAPAPHWFGSGSDVVAEASRWIGSGKFTAAPGPWCADAVSAWLERTGHRPLGNRMASSALSYGPKLSGPEVGALAVLGTRRGWVAHVGIVAGIDADGSIELISGNWGRRVAEATVSRGAVVAFVAVR